MYYFLSVCCSFYRFVMEADVSFLGNDTLSPGPMARFTEIPESPLLTLNMITPESWMVEAVQSSYDLDNIHLQEVPAENLVHFWVNLPFFLLICISSLCCCSQVSGAINAEYELEYLLLEGHCFDLSTGQPPRGLQFTLGMKQEPLVHDTIVMANLVRNITTAKHSFIKNIIPCCRWYDPERWVTPGIRSRRSRISACFQTSF